MPELKENSVSGFLPSAEAFAIHYPGYPSSMSRAVETLGGTQKILKVHGSKSNKLELHFRPEDPYSHPTFGELRPCNKFLFKISHPKSDNTNKNDKEDRKTAREEEANLNFDMIARVPEAYHFEGMVDYQHVVAVHADASLSKKRNWAEMNGQCLEKVNLISEDKDDVMIIVPPLFAIKDVPESLVLKTPAAFNLKKKEEIVHNPLEVEVDIEPVLAIDFKIKDVPKTVNWEEYIPPNTEQWGYQIAVSKLFEERPIWPKDLLVERLLDNGLHFRIGMFRRLLSRIAYYFSRGPFQRFWIKKGYDPRKDRDSRIYQRLDFRVPLSLRSYCNFNDSNKPSYRRGEICAFQVFPCKFHTSLQLLELEDDFIQEEIRKPSEEPSCSFESGWFSQRVLNCLRQRVMMKFLSVFPVAGAEALLKAATLNFEKLKREQKKDCLKIDQRGDQQISAAVFDEEQVEADYDEDDEEDVEFDMDGDDDEISLEQHSYQYMDNISRSHLQELFGSFPSLNEAGEKIATDEISEEDDYDDDDDEDEYQIYEQDSDTLNSEDDS